MSRKKPLKAVWGQGGTGQESRTERFN